MSLKFKITCSCKKNLNPVDTGYVPKFEDSGWFPKGLSSLFSRLSVSSLRLLVTLGFAPKNERMSDAAPLLAEDDGFGLLLSRIFWDIFKIFSFPQNFTIFCLQKTLELKAEKSAVRQYAAHRPYYWEWQRAPKFKTLFQSSLNSWQQINSKHYLGKFEQIIDNFLILINYWTKFLEIIGVAAATPATPMAPALSVGAYEVSVGVVYLDSRVSVGPPNINGKLFWWLKIQ